MRKETIMQLLSTLSLIEVKGFHNINYMCGVMNTLQKELNNLDEVGDMNGASKQ